MVTREMTPFDQRETVIDVEVCFGNQALKQIADRLMRLMIGLVAIGDNSVNGRNDIIIDVIGRWESGRKNVAADELECGFVCDAPTNDEWTRNVLILSECVGRWRALCLWEGRAGVSGGFRCACGLVNDGTYWIASQSTMPSALPASRSSWL
ncbi:Uncharacterised protein [Mycobacteroides abscessus subsp. bolletii]|nr:Uncharacterised protein [Mycobacteroides abscessus subsp. bolletii]SHR50896.1 Uncharacterised protein [Mycobacteroides abscessus subsp. bolletii]SHS34050.1 Uncharacterised protein [Mycobacteroides abscessus subsp. bolletii]SHT02017.1 Uncharacterised protein [Mycobacteroides abscessus subsp. bolletii]SHX99421.1 Uncharacterised protein [Mycobacteroides abscessus subsp. bolletii]